MAIDTSGQVSVRGESSATTTNLQQGLCKAWVHYVQAGTQAIDDSFNLSSISDNAVGRTEHTLTNIMANNDYATPFHAYDGDSFMTISQGWDKTTSAWKNARSGGDFGTAVDADANGETVFGDLA